MKKINFILFLSILITLNPDSTITKSQNNLETIPLAKNIDYTVSTKRLILPRKNKFIEFQPDTAFGGAQAQGNYNYKNKTAQIINQNITYLFTNIKENRNPEQPNTKHSENLVRFGSFINEIIRGMPVVMYLFGELTDDNFEKMKLIKIMTK